MLLISLDTLRADHLGTYGYRRRRTSPNLDRLANDGIVFERHAASSPWTTPSHMTMLTSLSPTGHGVTSDFGELGVGFRGRGEVASLPDERLTLAEALSDRGWHTAAFTGGVTMDPALGFEQGFGQYDTRLTKLNPRDLERLKGWLDASAMPFFVFLHTFEVHAPYLRTRFLGDVVLDASRARLLERRLGKLAREPGWKSVRKGAEVMKRLHLYSREVAEALYDGGIWHADRWLGQLFEWMRERGLYEETLIVVTSDHGEQFSERDAAFYDTHGHTLYEELVHVPLIIKLPGRRRAGERIPTLTRAVDVMPTLLEAVGAAPNAHRMEGRDLLAGARAEAPALVLPALSEALSYPFEAKSFRDDRYKLIVSFGAEFVAESGRAAIPKTEVTRELYDLRSDPGELTNLLDSPAAPEVAARAEAMERGLREHLSSIRGQADRVVLDDTVLERLRALGYIR